MGVQVRERGTANRFERMGERLGFALGRLRRTRPRGATPAGTVVDHAPRPNDPAPVRLGPDRSFTRPVLRLVLGHKRADLAVAGLGAAAVGLAGGQGGVWAGLPDLLGAVAPVVEIGLHLIAGPWVAEIAAGALLILAFLLARRARAHPSRIT